MFSSSPDRAARKATSAVVLIGVGRHAIGRDDGTRRRHPFSRKGYYELRLDGVLGSSVKGGGARCAARACLRRRDSGAYPAGTAREVHEPTDERGASARPSITDSSMGLGADMEQTEHGDRPTCGEGLAANAVLPAKLAELITAQAKVLERHTRALDLTDATAQKELDAYTKLERAHRDVAGELADLAEEMASYRTLPMGRHDMTVMTDPKGQMEAFRRFVAVERELLALLQAKLEADGELLR